MLAANDNVVRPLVENSVAGVGAHDEVLARRGIEVNLGKPYTAVDCETADIVVDHRAQGAVVEANGVKTLDSRDSIVPDRSGGGVVSANAFTACVGSKPKGTRQCVLYFYDIVPGRCMNPGMIGLIEKEKAFSVLPSPDKLIVMNQIPRRTARYENG